MITVEIMASNLAFFEEFELEDQLSYREFYEISLNMELGEFIKFMLYEDGELFYQGIFEKTKEDQNVKEDIFSVLESYHQQKKMSRKQKKEIQKKLNQALEKKETVEESKETAAFNETRSQRYQKQSSDFLYKTMIFFVSGIVILAIGLTVYSLFGKTPLANVTESATYEQLLEQKQYILASEKYPEKKEEIANYLFTEISQSNESLSQLEEYYQVVSSDFEALDIFLLESDYTSGITEYEKGHFSFDSTDLARGTFVGYAYLKLEQLEKAEYLCQQISSLELEKLIASYKQYQLQIQVIEKEIAELETDPLSNKDQIMSLIDELYDTKQNLAAL